ncbi:hypothetical protein T439DRAFT_358121 [Meredithblackwellia eburnea MCA 4105]
MARTARSGLPFPTLSLLVIYTTNDLSATGEENRRSPDDKDDGGRGTSGDEEVDEREQEGRKVLFLRSSEPDLTKQRRDRLLGTVMGLADFARMLGTPKASTVQSVHSNKQRMIWLEPESGYFIHATIELPRTSRHSRAASAATVNSTMSTTTVPSSQAPLEDASLLASLEQAYRSFRLQNGSFESLIQKEGNEKARERLDVFWSSFSLRWNLQNEGAGSFERVLGGLSRSPFLTTKTEPQLSPLLTQFAASNTSALPILLHGPGVLSLPLLPNSSSPSFHPRPGNTSSPPILTEEDLGALIRHLIATTPPPTALSVKVAPVPPPKPSTPIPSSAKTPRLAADSSTMSSSPSKWTSYATLGINSYLPTPALPSMPAMPTMPALPSMPAMPGLTNLPMPYIPTSFLPSSSSPSQSAPSTPNPSAKADEHSSSGLWGLRSVSWGLGLRGKKPSGSPASSIMGVEPSSTPPVPALPSPSLSPSTATTYPPPPAIPQATSSPSNDLDVTEALVNGENTNVNEVVVHDTNEDSGKSEGAENELVLVTGLADKATPEGEGPSPTEPARLSAAEDDDLGPEEGQRSPIDSETGDDSDIGSEIEEEEKAHEREVLKFWSEGGIQFEVRRYQRGTLMLALATSAIDQDSAEWLEVRSERLLEAVETIFDLAVPSKPPYPHRHIVKHGRLRSGNGWATTEEQWSGKATVEENEVTMALFECYKGLSSHPPIHETLVRTSSSQWAIGKRSDDVASPSKSTFSSSQGSMTDVYVVLPAKVGKDGSLIDASDELRKLERAYKGVV